MASLSGKNFFANRWITGDKSAVQSFDPKTGEALAPSYAGISDADLAKACQAAWQAFLHYRDMSRQSRAVFLQAIADEIEALGHDLVARAMAETGLPQARIEGERSRTCGQLRLFARVIGDGVYQDIRIDEALPERTPLPRPDLRYRKIPLGPVAVFGASNFPLAFSVAGGDTASALAAGCPVLVKAHSAHAGTSELVGQAIAKAIATCDMPAGVFSLLFGVGNNIGQELAQNPHVKAIGFTGSRRGGVALMHTAASRPEPIPVYAEMSSINPVYLMPQALGDDAEGIAKGLVNAMMMGAGQFCTSPGLVFAVKGTELDNFCQQAKAYIEAQAGQVMLTAGIHRAFCQGLERLSALPNVALLGKGQHAGSANHGAPHLFVTDAATLLALTDEVFGSAAVIVACDSLAQIRALTETLEGQLTAAVHANDRDDAADLRALIALLERKAGRILFNGFGTGVEVCAAMVHGGPFPATSDSRTTSVGETAIERFLRPVCYQNIPQALLPDDIRS